MDIETGRLGAPEIAGVAIIPLIVIGALAAGCVWEMLKGFVPSEQSIELCLFIDISLVLIVLGVWLSCFKLCLYLVGAGVIIWLLPMGFSTILIFGELQNTEPVVLIIYLVVLLSTVLVTLFLWKERKEKEQGT